MAPAPSDLAAIFSWPAPLWSWWLAWALRFVARLVLSFVVFAARPARVVGPLAPRGAFVARLAPSSLFVARPAARSTDFAVFDAVFDRTACRGPERRFDRWTFAWAGNCRVRCSLRRCRSMAGQHRAASRFRFVSWRHPSACSGWSVPQPQLPRSAAMRAQCEIGSLEFSGAKRTESNNEILNGLADCNSEFRFVSIQSACDCPKSMKMPVVTARGGKCRLKTKARRPGRAPFH